MAIDIIDIAIARKLAGGGGGTSDYSALTNKPSINGVTLSGDKTGADLGIPSVYFSYSNGRINISNTEPLEIVTWANGTPAQLAAMLDAHYAGEIDIHDYWSVGDTRTIHLSAMEAGDLEAHVEQDVQYVLADVGGKTLTTSVGDITECAFAVVQKDALMDGTSDEKGKLNLTSGNAGGWEACARRTWCNTTYRNAFPADIKPLFRQFKNITSAGSTNPSTAVTSDDYFALLSEMEFFGRVSYGNETVEANNHRFSLFSQSAYQHKLNGDTFWTRTPRSTDVTWVFSMWNGSMNDGADYATGIAPFGCI